MRKGSVQFNGNPGDILVVHRGRPQGCFLRLNVKLPQLVFRQTLQESQMVSKHFSEDLPRNVPKCTEHLQNITIPFDLKTQII